MGKAIRKKKGGRDKLSTQLTANRLSLIGSVVLVYVFAPQSIQRIICVAASLLGGEVCLNQYLIDTAGAIV